MRFVPAVTDPPEDLEFEALGEAVAVDAVALAVVFGSYAAGEPGRLSDLDVALQFSADVSLSSRLEHLDALTVAIIDRTGIEAVDVIDLDTVGPRLGYEALATGTLVTGDRSVAVDLETEYLVRWLDFKPVKRAWDAALDARIRDGSYGRP